MKEIIYDGNLNNDIKNSNKKFNLKKEIISATLSTSIAIIIAYLTLHPFGFVPSITNFSSFLPYLAGWVCIVGVYSALRIKKAKENMQIEKENAEINIEDLSKSLEEQNIKTDKKTFQDSISKEEKNSEINIVNGKTISKEEKLITYFYLLDKEEQIQVLKQINSKIKKGKDISENKQLFLLEKEDIANMTMPIQKQLKFK